MAQSAMAVPIVTRGQSSSQIVVGERSNDTERFAAEELQSYIERLATARLDIVDPNQALAAQDGALLLIGQPDSNSLVGQLLDGQYDLGTLKDEGFVIHTGDIDGRPAVAIVGQNDIATNYAVYALLEMLGATFLLSGDVLPPPVDELTFPATSRVWEPAFSRRGLQPFPNDLQDVTWGVSHYKKIIDQMVKLRMNYLEFFVQAYQPWVEYTYRGEKNLLGDLSSPDSGYIVISRTVPSCNVSEVQIGKEHFEGMRRMAPPEMQHVESQEEAVRVFSSMIQEIQAYAKSKGITNALSLDPTYVAPNHARFARRYGERPHSSVYGAHVAPNDPVGLEISEAWLRAIFATYPNTDDVFLFVAENYDVYDDPQSFAAIKDLRPHFANARRTVEQDWPSVYERANLTPDQVIDCVVGSLAYVRDLVEVVKGMNPDVRVGVSFFFKGFILPDADKIVDRDVPFMDMQSWGVRPYKNGVNALYFSNMGERDRYINCRVDEDASMFGMPFYLRQYRRDGLFADAHKAGVSGFVGQIFRSRGTEHQTRFLSQGAWDPELTPEKFYQEYSREIFGSAAAEYMEGAFSLLEDTDEWLEWQGAGNFGFSGGCRELNRTFGPELLSQENPYYGPADPPAMAAEAEAREALFTRAVDLLGRAAREMHRARPLASAKGEPLLRYLVSKTEAFKSHLEMVVLLDRAFAAYAKAFADHTDDEAALTHELDKAETMFVAAGSKARATTERAGEIVDELSDLGILFLSNVWNVAKCDKVVDLVRRVVNFHHGRPYWKDPVSSKSG